MLTLWIQWGFIFRYPLFFLYPIHGWEKKINIVPKYFPGVSSDVVSYDLIQLMCYEKQFTTSVPKKVMFSFPVHNLVLFVLFKKCIQIIKNLIYMWNILYILSNNVTILNSYIIFFNNRKLKVETSKAKTSLFFWDGGSSSHPHSAPLNT